MRTNLFALIGATSVLLCATGVQAGGLSSYKDQAFAPPVMHQDMRSFYVRGDIGVAQHDHGKFSQADLEAVGGSFVSADIGDTAYVGAGFGWELGRGLRIDLTGEYRISSDLNAMDTLTDSGIADDGQGNGVAATLNSSRKYEGELNAFVGLANIYWDIGNWRGFTPYVGGGIGFAHVELDAFSTINTAEVVETATGRPLFVQANTSTSVANSETNFAWALMAGTSYDISSNGKLDIGYRYLDMGDGVSLSSDIINCVCGEDGEPLEVSDLTSHEFRVGVRWKLSQPTALPSYK